MRNAFNRIKNKRKKYLIRITAIIVFSVSLFGYFIIPNISIKGWYSMRTAEGEHLTLYLNILGKYVINYTYKPDIDVFIIKTISAGRYKKTKDGLMLIDKENNFHYYLKKDGNRFLPTKGLCFMKGQSLDFESNEFNSDFNLIYSLYTNTSKNIKKPSDSENKRIKISSSIYHGKCGEKLALTENHNFEYSIGRLVVLKGKWLDMHNELVLIDSTLNKFIYLDIIEDSLQANFCLPGGCSTLIMLKQADNNSSFKK